MKLPITETALMDLLTEAEKSSLSQLPDLLFDKSALKKICGQLTWQDLTDISLTLMRTEYGETINRSVFLAAESINILTQRHA